MSASLMLPREPVAALVNRLVAERDDQDLIKAGLPGGGLGQLARELSAFSGSAASWERRLYTIRTGVCQRKPHWVHWCDVATGEERKRQREGDYYTQAEVTFEVVDRMITALELTHVWFGDGELAGLLPEPEIEPEEEPAVDEQACPSCGRHRDPDYEPAETMVGDCSLCIARRAPKMKRGALRIGDLFRLYERYITEGMPMSRIAEQEWEALGFTNETTLASRMAGLWTELGWPTRTIWQSKTLRARLYPTMPKTLRDHGGEPFVRQLHALHWHRKQSINSMAIEFGKQWGVSRSRLSSEISTAFAKLGLPAHDRIAMTVAASTKNGLSPRDWRERRRVRLEAGLTQKGKERQAICGHIVKGRRSGQPCELPAMKGKTHCQQHDPARQAQLQAQMERMRAVSQDPAKFEPVAPLKAEILEAAEQVGWKALDVHYGGHKGHLSKLARGKMPQVEKSGRIGKERAKRIRLAIAKARADLLLAQVREAVDRQTAFTWTPDPGLPLCEVCRVTVEVDDGVPLCSEHREDWGAALR